MDEPLPMLHSLDGNAAPHDLRSDLLALLSLPEPAARKLWEVLGPALAEPIPPSTERAIDAFCARHEAPGEPLARGLKAARFLLRAAVRRGVDRDRFASDLAALAGDDAPRLTALVMPGFAAATRFLRHEIVRRTVAAHGKVVDEVDWRIEKIVASSHGEPIDCALVAVTLRYREGDRVDRITLHLEPEALAELARAHARLSSA